MKKGEIRVLKASETPGRSFILDNLAEILNDYNHPRFEEALDIAMKRINGKSKSYQ
jgi:hypothetical protein